MSLTKYKPTKSGRMKFELYEWFMQEFLEDGIYSKCRTVDVEEVCLRLGNLFEEELNAMNYTTLEEIYYDTFPETDIDCGGML